MTDEAVPSFQASGRLRRLGALVVDGLVLAAVGAFVAYLFYDWACRVGPYGRLVGFVLMPVYFGVGASGLTGGRTLGKALCGIRTSGIDGPGLSLQRGIARATVLTWPYLLNGWAIKPMLEWPILGGAAAIAIFGVGGSIVYLFLFNRRTGQAFHDLVVGSVVSRKGSAPLGTQPPLPSVHRAVVGALLLLPFLLAGAGYLAQGWFDARLGTHSELWSQLNEDLRFHSVGVRYMTHYSSGSTVTIASVHAWLKEEPADRSALAAELANKAVAHYSDDAPDKVRITLQRGYDLGISSAKRMWNDTRTPDEWD